MSGQRWWWVRHAPLADAEGRLAAHDDGPPVLDRQRIGRLAARLPRAARWLASPLPRALLTAQALAEAAGLPPPRAEPAFAEQDFGEWSGRRYDALGIDWTAPAFVQPPGGESFDAAAARVAAAIETTDAAGDVVAVSHAGPIRAALMTALGLAPDAALRIAVDTLSITRIDRLDAPGALWVVRFVNRTPADD